MFKEYLIKLALPLILAPLVLWLTQASKRAWTWLDRADPAVKQGFAAFYATAFTALAQLVESPICTGGALTCDLVGLDWRVILTWAVSMALHGRRRKADP